MGTTDGMAVPEQQAAEMLEEMIKSTHHLDEILQQMCAADSRSTWRKATNGSDSESDAEFEDCISAPQEQDGQATAEEYLRVRG
jgi:hypothetical protein